VRSYCRWAVGSSNRQRIPCFEEAKPQQLLIRR
jgi:hypothetical protein